MLLLSFHFPAILVLVNKPGSNIWKNVIWRNSKMVKPVVPRLLQLVERFTINILWPTRAAGTQYRTWTSGWCNGLQILLQNMWDLDHFWRNSTRPKRTAVTQNGPQTPFMCHISYSKISFVPTGPTFERFRADTRGECFQIFWKLTLVFAGLGWEQSKELRHSFQS